MAPSLHAHSQQAQSARDRAQANIKRMEARYCAKASPSYCAEFVHAATDGLTRCLYSRSDAVSIFNEIKLTRLPPQMVMRNISKAETHLTDDDIADIVRSAAASKTDDAYAFADSVLDKCIAKVGDEP
jgi:hypothetical protein